MVDHLNGTAEATEGFAVDGVRVAGGVEVRAGFVDGTVDCEGWAVDGSLGAAGLDFAVLVDEDEITDADLREVCAEGVDPEMFWVDGVAEGW